MDIRRYCKPRGICIHTQAVAHTFAWLYLLLLVALHCPQVSRQRQATAWFEHWINQPMTGISALALSSIYRHRASENYGSTSAPDASVALCQKRGDLDEGDALSSSTLNTSSLQTNMDVVHVGPAPRDATRDAGSDVASSHASGLAWKCPNDSQY